MSSQLTIALAGNPNSGKTTAFNALTGSHQHVGNYPGITVERKEGSVHMPSGETVRIIDLPGTYSLTAYTQEETVARMVLVRERPDVVVGVLNAGALERNLYLAVQLLELGIPVVLALNMMDEAQGQGMTIDLERLSARMHLPVLPTVARTGKGLPEVLEAALAFAKERQNQPWQPLHISYGSDLDPVLTRMEKAIADAGLLAPEYPARWVAIKLLELDEEMLTRSRAANAELTARLEREVDEVTAHLRDTLDTWPEAVIADYRYGFISSLLRDGVLVRRVDVHRRLHLTDHMDHVLTHPLVGPLIMFGVLYLLYKITFSFGAIPMGWVESGFALVREVVDGVLADGPLKSLILSGIIDGVGGVMSFVPLIMLIFLQISFLEDSGYMARMAYMLDRVFRIFGLHGCSVMPFIIGGGIAGGCAVPGVLAARTLRSPREKLATLLTVPFMACGAKLPVFILFAGVFFPRHEATVMFGLTLAGWVVALLTARLLRSTIIRGPSTPFVMELPPYRLPTLLGLGIHTGERTLEYLKKAGTVILAVSVLLWAAMTYPTLPLDTRAGLAARQQTLEAEMQDAERTGGNIGALEYALAKLHDERAELSLRHSFAGRFGVALEPLTKPAGFDWRTDIALVGGFAAKEVIVATLGTAYSL
ncbi:MAG: ferrous iron transport protein B, partial [Bilophila sp.]